MNEKVIEAVESHFFESEPLKVTLDELGWFTYVIGFKNIVWQDGYLIAFTSAVDEDIVYENNQAFKVYSVYLKIILYCKSQYKRYITYNPITHTAKLQDRLPNMYDGGESYCAVFPYPAKVVSTVLNRIKELEEKDD